MPERCFLVPELPEAAKRWKTQSVRMAWLNAGGRDIAIRQSGKRGQLSLGLNPQAELNPLVIPLNQIDFERLWEDSPDCQLSFVSHSFQTAGQLFRVEEYGAKLSGLRCVRWSSQGNCLPGAVRDWLGMEISYDTRFSYKQLAHQSVKREDINQIMGPIFSGAIGAVPYIRQSDGIRLVLCTTQRGGRWIFPKGQPKAGTSNKDIALLEAAEEAGLLGEITGEPILCGYGKVNTPVNLMLFPMEVKSMLKVWQEINSRERALLTIEEAKNLMGAEDLEAGLSMIQAHLADIEKAT